MMLNSYTGLAQRWTRKTAEIYEEYCRVGIFLFFRAAAKRQFQYRRVVKTGVKDICIGLGRGFHSNQFKTTFYPPAVMECRLCLPAHRTQFL
jgi:hypothetical protein